MAGTDGASSALARRPAAAALPPGGCSTGALAPAASCWLAGLLASAERARQACSTFGQFASAGATSHVASSSGQPFHLTRYSLPAERASGAVSVSHRRAARGAGPPPARPRRSERISSTSYSSSSISATLCLPRWPAARIQPSHSVHAPTHTRGVGWTCLDLLIRVSACVWSNQGRSPRVKKRTPSKAIA